MMKAVWIIFYFSSIAFASRQDGNYQNGTVSSDLSVSLLSPTADNDGLTNARILQQNIESEAVHEMVGELICHVVAYELMLESGAQHSRLYSCRPIYPDDDEDAQPHVEYRLENVPTQVRNLLESQLGEITVISMQNAYIDVSEMFVTSADWLSVRLLPEYAEKIRSQHLQRQRNRLGHLRNRRQLSVNQTRSLIAPQGQLSLLPILITTSDGKSPDYTPNALFNLLFVGDGSVKMQFTECSFGKLSLEPTQLQVLSVRVDMTMSDARGNSNKLINRANSVALQQVRDYVRGTYTVNDLQDFADLIMFITPDLPDWVAYAEVHGTTSVYNNEWGASLGVVMHEIGHNFGLGHANERGEYKDYSSYMGGALQGYHTNPRSPLMSYNGYHHVKLGWFDSVHIRSFEPASFTPSTLLRIVAFTDYDVSIGNGSECVVAKVGNLYLQYNRAKKFNAGVIEYEDHLVIVEHKVGTGETELVAALAMTEANRVFRTGSSLVELCSEHRSSNVNAPDYVVVSIGGSGTSSSCMNDNFPDKKTVSLNEESNKDETKLNQDYDRGGIRRRKRALRGSTGILEA